MLPQLALEPEQIRLGVDLEGERVVRAPLAPAAGPVLPPQRREGVRIAQGRRQEPPRTARTWLLFVLSLLFTFPLLKFTFHAFVGLVAYVDADQ